MWDRGLIVQNVTFINFPNNQTPAILGPTILDRCTERCGGIYLFIFVYYLSIFLFCNNLGWLTKFVDVSFINVALRGRFRWPYDGLYEDTDGTLTGQNQSVVLMAPDGLNNASSACTSSPYFENAIQCPPSEGPWVRVGISDYTYSFGHEPLSITDEDNHNTTVLWFERELTHSNGYMMVLRVNRTYTLSFSGVSVS